MATVHLYLTEPWADHLAHGVHLDVTVDDVGLGSLRRAAERELGRPVRMSDERAERDGALVLESVRVARAV